MKDLNCKILEEFKEGLSEEQIQKIDLIWRSLKSEIEERAYMEGYCYAIQVLEESLKNKNFKIR